MNKLIGITGGMSSGKTTLCKKLIELNPDYIYIDVDDFRRSLYKNNESMLSSIRALRVTR